MPGDISVVVVSSPVETPRKRGSLLGRRETWKYEIGSLAWEQRTLMSSARREPGGRGVAMTSDTGAEGGCTLSPDVPGRRTRHRPQMPVARHTSPPRKLMLARTGAATGCSLDSSKVGGTVRPPAWLGRGSTRGSEGPPHPGA